MRRFVLVLIPILLPLSACVTTVRGDVAPPLVHFSGLHTTVNTARSSITFLGRSSIVNHEGRFTRFEIVLRPNSVTPADFEKATLQAVVDLSSIETDVDGLTAHLQKPEFFDVATSRNATFTSTSISRRGDFRYDVTGNLTVKGIEKQITFTATVSDNRLVLEAELPRRDFSIGNDAYGQKILNPLVPVTVTAVLE